MAAQTSDAPGDRELEGVQAPALTVEKLSPREIQVNREAEFAIVVRNVGRVMARDVRVFDEIPAGTEFLTSVPKPNRTGQRLDWKIGELRPGQEKRITVQLKPTRPGEIGSVAHVTFATQATMRTRVTKPILEIRHSSRPQALIGDPVYGGRRKLSPKAVGEAGAVAAAQFARQALHAAELGFDHPVSGTPLTFAAELPNDMSALLLALQNTE